MQVGRRQIRKHYDEFAQGYAKRTIDDLCKGGPGAAFELQVQQLFLRKLVKDHDIRQMLLYHNIGAGKTCTAITMAEEHMAIKPAMKVLVILPARLRTNFYNELMSSCTGFKYISEKDFEMYNNSVTSALIKKNILSRFMRAVSLNYTVMSFERFRIDAMKSPSPRDYLVKLVKNKVVIIDEIHNMINVMYNAQHLAIIASGAKPKLRSLPAVNTILIKTMVTYAEKSTRFIFLTATPVFDNTKQFGELVRIMNPSATVNVQPHDKNALQTMMKLLAGRVSYFPGSSPVAYPSVSYINHDILPSVYQLKILEYVRSLSGDAEGNEEQLSNSFFSLERRASILAYIDEDLDDSDDSDYHTTFDETIKLAIRNPQKYMPKIGQLIENINDLPGKHLVYSNFVQYGTDLVARILSMSGWVNILDVLSGRVAGGSPYKCYAMWDGATKDTEKDAIKTIMNSVDNMDGKLIKVVLGSPSMKEGVSFKHIQHFHLLDPVWNQSTKTQVEGRAIRFCSHFDIPLNHPTLKRHVDVHLYKIVYPYSSAAPVIETDKLPSHRSLDTHIYDFIIAKKHDGVKKAEAALRKVAFDYYLFRKLYKDNVAATPDSKGPSEYDVTDDGKVNVRKPNRKQQKNTCPKPRRLPCKAGYEERLNGNQEPCCYKQKQLQSTCPKPRRPPCGHLYEQRVNAHGDECCYKTTK